MESIKRAQDLISETWLLFNSRMFAEATMKHRFIKDFLYHNVCRQKLDDISKKKLERIYSELDRLESELKRKAA